MYRPTKISKTTTSVAIPKLKQDLSLPNKWKLITSSFFVSFDYRWVPWVSVVYASKPLITLTTAIPLLTMLISCSWEKRGRLKYLLGRKDECRVQKGSLFRWHCEIMGLAIGTCSPCLVIMVVWFNPWGCAEMKTSPTFSNSPLSRINQYLSLINYFLMESVPFILANPWDNVHGYGWIEVIKLLTFTQNFQTFLPSISELFSRKTSISLLCAFSLCLSAYYLTKPVDGFSQSSALVHVHANKLTKNNNNNKRSLREYWLFKVISIYSAIWASLN